MMRKAKFGDWLKQSLNFVKYDPTVWLGYSAVLGLSMPVGHVSLALGVFLSVTGLFVGVGVAKYIDMKRNGENPVGLVWAVKKSLPLAVLCSAAIVVCWFVLMVAANILKGEYQRILLFFFHYELTPEILRTFLLTETAAWVYGYANVALFFTLLMVGSFVGWFVHPLMLFQNMSWSEAKAKSAQATAANQAALYQLYGFVFVQALLCSGLTPLLTPVLYMLTSTLLYVSYKSLFDFKKRQPGPVA